MNLNEGPSKFKTKHVLMLDELANLRHSLCTRSLSLILILLNKEKELMQEVLEVYHFSYGV